MSGMILLKIFGDLCVFCVVVGSLPELFACDFLLVWPALLCAAGVAVAVSLERFRKPWLKVAALILPLSSLLFADSLMEYLILVPMLLYTAVVILRGLYYMEYYSFREQFTKVGIGLLIFSAFILAFGFFEGSMNPGQTVYDVGAALLYTLLYGFSGVFLMRQLRLGVDSQSTDRMWNNISMIAILAVIMLVTVGLVFAQDMLLDSLSALITGFFSLLGVLPVMFQSVSDWIDLDIQSQQVQTTETNATETVGDAAPQLQPNPGIDRVTQNSQDFPWWLVVLILAAMVVALILLLRNLSRSTNLGGSEAESSFLEEPKAQAVQNRRSNRNKIRKFYRAYLKLMRKQGVSLRTDQTSLDVLNASSKKTDQGSEVWLRQLYLKARYDEQAVITEQDVADAKAALSRLQAGR